MIRKWLGPYAIILFTHSSMLYAQEPSSIPSRSLKPIAVEEITSDKKIERRLSEILAAVGNYDHVKVQVLSGVVILSGIVDEDHQIEWVGDLASRLDGVVAVQNQITSHTKKIFDLTLAREEIGRLTEMAMHHLPTIVLALVVLILFFLIFFIVFLGIRRVFAARISSLLLLNVIAKALAIPVLLVGLYLALKISGLTGLAFTIMGGTGLFGLVLGLGLKNIFEDYAASIFLSVKKPFRPSDWVTIGNVEGIVQQVTSRSTLIMDFTGNHVLIPNSLVYSSIIINKTANPKMRGDFVFGIDYSDSIEEAQITVLELLRQSQLVLKDPEPWVLVDELGGSAVNLRVYFWLNVREVSLFKVSSYLLLEVKRILLAKGFRFPDPHREVVFTNRLEIGREAISNAKQQIEPVTSKTPKIDEVRAEASELNRQARESDLPDQGEDVF